MPRIFLVWLILASVIGWGVYQVKYEVQRLETKLVRLNRTIVADQEMIQVLSAEWSYLNQPQNLEVLSRRWLELEPLTGKQFTTIEQIPMRGAPQTGSMKQPPAVACHARSALPRTVPLTFLPTFAASAAASPSSTRSTR